MIKTISQMQRTCASLAILLGLLLAASAAAPLAAQATPADPHGKAVRPLKPLADPPPLSISKQLKVGESQVYTFDGISTAAVGDPTVAGVVPISTGRLLINAKAPGRTTVFVFDRRGENVIHLSVVPGPSGLASVAERIDDEIGQPNIMAHAVNDTILIEGTATPADAQRAEAIALAYTPKVKNLIAVETGPQNQTLAQTYADLLSQSLTSTGITVKVIDEDTIALTGTYAAPIAPPPPHEVAEMGDQPGSGSMAAAQQAPQDPLTRMLASLPPALHVVNLVNFQTRTPKQILVRAKVIDIDRTATKSLGIDWGTLSNTVDSNGNVTVNFNQQPITIGQEVSSTYTGSLLGGGPLKRVLPLGAQLNALITEGKARVLSQPSLMVLDGNQGSMLVGGEIPIPVLQSASTNGGSSGITVEYKPFGVRLNVSPNVVSDDTVQLTVNPEVSTLDFTDGVEISGFLIPALTVRRATTTLQMHSGDTLVIGGLYSDNYNRTLERVPLLSQIPVLGEFFKHTVTNKEESELLILIEPEIVNPDTPGAQPPAPGSIENLPIGKPDVTRHEFDQDFPDLQTSPADRAEGASPAPVNLPAGK